MSIRWGVRLGASQLVTVARLRLQPDVQVLQEEEFIWLQGIVSDETLPLLLRTLPTEDCFTVLPDGQLIRSNETVPRGHLPEGNWQPLRTCFELGLPEVGWGGEVPHPAEWQLRRAAHFLEPNVLVTDWPLWFDFATTAPQVRLNGIRMAVNSQLEVVIHGQILPPLAGRRYIAQDGIAVAAGWEWFPRHPADVMCNWLKSHPDDLVLLHADGTCDRIGTDDFVIASRSAVRETDLALRSQA